MGGGGGLGALLWKAAQLMHDSAKPCVAEVCQWQFLHDEGLDAIDWSACSAHQAHLVHRVSRSIHQHCQVQERTGTLIQVWELMRPETFGHFTRILTHTHTHY